MSETLNEALKKIDKDTSVSMEEREARYLQAKENILAEYREKIAELSPESASKLLAQMANIINNRLSKMNP